MSNSYLRSPTIAGDTVIFVTEDDLWTVPVEGGTARRLTAGLGPVSNPALSADGSMVAFSSREEFHNEVYIMPAAGGQPTRLTYLGANSVVRGWTPDGKKVVFTSEAGKPLLRWSELRTVDVKTGSVESLPYGPAQEISFGADGAIAIGRHTVDPARWKRYRGGRAGHLWVDANGSGNFKRLTSLAGNVAHPMWIDGRIYFVADHEGVGNLYSVTPSGRGIKRHTDHHEYYARFASSDGSTIVYQHAAELWALTPGEDARRIDVETPSPRTQRNRKFVDASKNLRGFGVHPKGHSIVLDARGRVVTLPLWEGPVREYAEADGVRYRQGAYLPDGERIVVISDEGGEERLEIRGPDGRVKRLDSIDIGRVHQLAVSPSANLVAVANHRLEVLLVDLDEGKRRLVDRSQYERSSGLSWSPDGAWLAYAHAETLQTRIIKVAAASGGKSRAITGPDFRDFEPVFDPTGSYLYFISYRHFDPVADAHFFDLGFPRGAKPYLVALRKDVSSPFVPEPSGLGPEVPSPDGDKDGKAAKGSAKKKPEPLAIDFDGISQRIAAFPVPEGRYARLGAVKGKVLMMARPVAGALGEGEEDETPGAAVAVYDFAKQKFEPILQGVDDFVIAADGATLIYRSGKRLRAVRAGEAPEKGSDSEPPGRRSGWIDLGRVRISVDPASEWTQMFSESWRLMRDNFWTEDLSGVDWEGVRERYRPLVDKVSTRLEFSDLIWEMQGELGTSHAYEMGGDHRPPPAYRMGYLGADISWNGKQWRIDRIVPGDAWDEQVSSPLAGIGVDVSEGDTILAVNGRPCGKGVPPQSLLVHQAKQRVELRIGDSAGKKPRTVSVKTLASEQMLRYRDWVESNRKQVHDATDGRVGYVHIPNMGGWGYSEFHRYYANELDREALIVDVRYNGGGNVSQVILEKLGRKRIGYDVKRWGVPEPYPSDSILGPLVCLTNEDAGSDGDIFTHCFKLMELGPVVGKRTWGGVIGIWPRHPLADGGVTTQPEFAFWFVDVGWGVENYGTDPDHDVDIAPHDYAAGFDPQMQKGLELITAALKKERPALPTFPAKPNLALPVLPSRDSVSTNGSGPKGARKKSAKRPKRARR